MCCEKKKCKIVPIHAERAYKGNRGKVPLILNLDIRCR